MSIVQMSEICMIIDLDGFMVNKCFYAREMGFINFKIHRPKMYRFDLEEYSKNLPRSFAAHEYFVSKNIHGMSFVPSAKERQEKKLYALSELEGIVVKEYEKCRKPERFYIGYKGGDIERNLLTKLMIPSINLEIFGCPKYDSMLGDPIFDVRFNCGYHQFILEGKTAHCPLAELFCFREWCAQHYSKTAVKLEPKKKKPFVYKIFTG